jgi:hypothetical protein
LGSIFGAHYYFHITVKKQVTICHSAIEACKNAEAVVIATEWKEFLEIDWEEVYKGMNKPAFVFDGRLLVDAEKLTKIGFKVGFIFACQDQFSAFSESTSPFTSLLPSNFSCLSIWRPINRCYLARSQQVRTQ